MKKSNQDDEGPGIDLFADQTSVCSDGSADWPTAESFPNPYAEASQARASGRSPMNIDRSSLPGSDQSDTTSTRDKGTVGQSLVDTIDTLAIAQVKPGKDKPETTRVLDEYQEAGAIPRMMTAHDVAAYLQVSVSKVWRLRDSNIGFPEPVKIGGSTRWDRQAIDHYLESLQTRRHTGH